MNRTTAYTVAVAVAGRLREQEIMVDSRGGIQGPHRGRPVNGARQAGKEPAIAPRFRCGQLAITATGNSWRVGEVGFALAA
jgi:hypothetical protein